MEYYAQTPTAFRCSDKLAVVASLFDNPADARQRRLAEERGSLEGLVEALAEEFLSAPTPTPSA